MKTITARVLGLAAIVALSLVSSFADPSMACCKNAAMPCCKNPLMRCCHFNHKPAGKHV
jgi:hypothetical protein